jgi:benzoyl-CoA reductase/2-hydroxyglutaryl-CoA dehydratase subunit BcrC/BadD/HgdB
MKREDLLKNLFVLNILLEELRKRTKSRLKENRKIRKLLKLPNTVPNKTSLKNYLNSTRQSASN